MANDPSPLDTLMDRYFSHQTPSEPLRCTRQEQDAAKRLIQERHGYVLLDERRRVLFFGTPLEVM